MVSATNKNLWQEVLEGRFRKDLYYRIAAIPFEIPPLRERKADLQVLIHAYLAFFSKEYSKQIKELSAHQHNLLSNHAWQGNIRELRSVMERFVLFGELSLEQNEEEIISNTPQNYSDTSKFAQLPTMRELEEQYLSYVLKYTGGKIYGDNGACKILGMTKSTLYKRIETFQLKQFLGVKVL